MAVGTTVIFKVRRGAYDALVADRQKMSVGEPCAVLSGDPSVPSGKAFYICFEAGDVRRMVSVEDLEIMASRGDFKGDKGEDGRGIMNLEIDARGRLIVTLTDGTRVDAGYVLDIMERIDASEQQRVQAEEGRVSAEQGRASAETSRRTAETDRDAAEQARISNEADRVSDEAVRISNEAARVSSETAREQAEQVREAAALDRERLWTEELEPAVGRAISATDAAAGKADAVVDDLIARRDAGEFRGEPFTYEDFTADQLAALKGETGSRGVGIASVERTSGNGASGSTDVYTITLTDGSTSTITVYNGADGQGAGDMLKSVYDAKGKNRDIFDYVDGSLEKKADLEDGRVPSSQLPSLDYVPTSEKGAAGGVAALGADGRVPPEQLPPLDYVPTGEKGQGGGVATLDMDGKVPSDQLPSMDYIPADEKGAASGVAALGADGRIPSDQLPSLDYEPSGSVESHDTSGAAHEDIRDDIDNRFSALSRVAFSGGYDDLTGTPSIPPVSDAFREGTIPTRDADGNTYLGRIHSNTDPEYLSSSHIAGNLYFMISHDRSTWSEDTGQVYIHEGLMKIGSGEVKSKLLGLGNIRSVPTDCLSSALRYRCICDIYISGNKDTMHIFDVYRTSGNITRFIVVSTVGAYSGSRYTKEVRFYKSKILEVDASDEISVFVTTDAKYSSYVRCYLENRAASWTREKFNVVMYTDDPVIEYGSDRPSLSSLPEGYISPGETLIL